MNNDTRFMRAALHAARQAQARGEVPVGAVVVIDDEIVGAGCNQPISTHDPTAHAEIVAIREACRALGSFQLDGCDFYTSCEPCPMCLGAIYWARIERIFYGFTVADAARIGFDDRFIFRELARPAGRRTVRAVQLLAAEARALAREYAADPRRARY